MWERPVVHGERGIGFTTFDHLNTDTVNDEDFSSTAGAKRENTRRAKSFPASTISFNESVLPGRVPALSSFLSGENSRDRESLLSAFFASLAIS